MPENNLEDPNTTESSDIFEGFSSDEELLQDVDAYEKNAKKDIYDYANMTGNVLKICNMVLFILCVFIISYIYIQQSSNKLNSAILDPFCHVLLGDIDYSDPHCSSVTSFLDDINSRVSDLKLTQFQSIAAIIQPLYLATDFINSSEVLFLRDKSENRLRPLLILEEFDRVKNTFESADKSALNCYDIEIKNNMLSAKCDTYSSDWDRSITLPDGSGLGNIGGTSISIASSFLDFIEQNSTNLKVVDKQKYFSSESVSGENGGYTKKTTFYLQIEYLNSNSLAL